MPYDITYRDKDGRTKHATIDDLVDTGDGYVRVRKTHRTVFDAGTTTKYIPKEHIGEVKGPRAPTIMETEYHPDPVDVLRSLWNKFK